MNHIMKISMVSNFLGHIGSVVLNFYYSYRLECDIAISTLVGAIIGLEREIRGKAAGIRTYSVIAMASCLFTIISNMVGGPHDPARIAANIVTGVGFIGAGVIWHRESGIEGLTTAASIWGVAAIGMAIGFGFMSLALTSAFTVLAIMELFGWVMQIIERVFHIKKQHRER